MKTDIKQDIGNRLVQMIKDMGEPIWRMPWVFAQPETAFGGKDYRGINQAMTAMYRMANGQKSHLWLTRKKIDELAGWKWDDSVGIHIRIGIEFIQRVFVHVDHELSLLSILYAYEYLLTDTYALAYHMFVRHGTYPTAYIVYDVRRVQVSYI